MKPTIKLSPLSRSIHGLLAPAALALALSWSGGSALATPAAGTAALNAQLQTYTTEETPTGSVPKKVFTTLTASDTDLARAVFDILQNGGPNAGPSAADLAAGALEGRKDANTVAARIVNAAIVAGDTTVTSTSDIVAIASAVLTDGSIKLTITGQEAITAAALQADADTASTAGSTIATAVLNDLHLTGSAATAFVEGALASVKPSAVLPSFVQQSLSVIGGGTATAIAIAVKDAKNPAAVNATIAGGAATLAGNDGSVVSFVQSAISNSKLSKVLSDVVAGGGTAYSGTAQAYAQALITSSDKITTLEGIASGALRVAGGTTTVGNQTSDILSNVFTGANAVTAKNAASIAAGVGVGLGSVDVGATTRAAEVAQILEGDAVSGGAKVQTAIAQALINDVSVSAPDAAAGIAANTATAEGINSNIASSEALASALAKGTKAAAAAGSAVAGIADLAAFNTSTNNQAAIAAAGIKGNSKAAVNIALEVTSLASTPASQESLALTLANNSGVSSAAVPNAIAGSAAAFGDSTETVSSKTVYTVTDFVSSVLTNPALLPNAVKIATSVAGAVNEEEIANVATAVSAKLGSNAKLKLTSASALATALVAAAEAKPNVNFTNRAEEVAEITASIVAGVLGKSSTGSSDAANAAAEEKLIASIGAAVMKAAGTKLQSNTLGASNVPVDLKDALEVQSIAGAIAQTISVALTSGAFDATVKSDLIAANGPLEAALAKAAGKAYTGDVATAFSNVFGAGAGNIYQGANPGQIGSNGFVTATGAYQIGSVVREETPTKNI